MAWYIIIQRTNTGKGAIVDTAMIDGVSTLMTPIKDLAALGAWVEDRSSNLLDGGAPFYRTYRTADDRFMAVGALEQVFFDALLVGLGMDPESIPDRLDQQSWAEIASAFERVFASKTQAEWQEVFDGTDACVTPVLQMSEVGDHPHNASRNAIVTVDGVDRPALVPRFASSP